MLGLFSLGAVLIACQAVGDTWIPLILDSGEVMSGFNPAEKEIQLKVNHESNVGAIISCMKPNGVSI